MLNLKNTLDGYLKNVEVIGNTIQDENNLANIRSVGDKVGGQELYKIDVVSCGKNIFNGEFELGTVTYSSNFTSYNSMKGVSNDNSRIRLVKLQQVKPNTRYTLKVEGSCIESFGFQLFDKNKCGLNIEPSRRPDSLTYTMPSDCYYVNIYCAVTPGTTDISNIKCMLETDTHTTEYEPYQEQKLEILSPVQLEKVGDVADRIICKDGVWGVDKKVNAEVRNNVLVNTRTNSEFIPLPHDQQVKLRTFAGQTNIAFLTEIPGQIKAQVPKSLGATVNTHTEQIADLHNSLERVKKLEESTVSTVETESSFTTVNETSNGYFEDVKLEGKTLVNLLGTQGMGVITLDTSGNRSKKFINVNHLNGKIYTIVFNITRNSNDTGVFLNHYTNANNSVHTVKICNGGTIGLISTALTLGNNYNNELNMYIQAGSSGVVEIEDVLLLEGDHTNNPPEYFEGLMSVGQDVEEVSVESRNSDETQSNKKPLLYYNPTTETWEKPILREWDTIEKHSDGKYYYHKRSGEVVLNGSEDWILSDDTLTNTIRFIANSYLPGQAKTNAMFICNTLSFDKDWFDNDVEGYSITNPSGHMYIRINRTKLSTQDVAGFKAWLKANPTTLVYQLAQEEVYECTNIDLMTYSGETNYIINSGAISPKSLLKVHNNISNVVKILQEKVSLLENTFIAGLKSVLSGDMYSLATILYPEDFEQNDNTEQDIMVIPE